MRPFGLPLIASAGLLTFPAMGQEPSAKRAPSQNVQFVNTQDGGVREVLESIAVPPKVGAPFTLTLETEWRKQLYDGGTGFAESPRIKPVTFSPRVASLRAISPPTNPLAPTTMIDIGRPPKRVARSMPPAGRVGNGLWPRRLGSGGRRASM